MGQQMQFVRTMVGAPEKDVAQRIIRNCVVATVGLASDGWIILPSGMNIQNYIANPVVTSRHLMQPPESVTVADGKPVVIARALSLTRTTDELVADTIQFADTREGRDFAYLYGCNEAGEVYMRAWSIEGVMLNRTEISFERAQQLSGPYWDPQTAARVQKSQKKVFVCGDFEMLSFAAVAVGADKKSLTRAFDGGVATAGDILARMDLNEAGGELAELKKQVDGQNATIARLEREIQALRGEGASAAARRDSEAVLAAVRELNEMLSPKNK